VNTEKRKVDMKLVKSRKWKRLEKKIKSKKLIPIDSSNWMERACLRKIMIVDGICPACGYSPKSNSDSPFLILDELQDPQTVMCEHCGARYGVYQSLVMGAYFQPDDGRKKHFLGEDGKYKSFPQW